VSSVGWRPDCSRAQPAHVAGSSARTRAALAAAFAIGLLLAPLVAEAQRAGQVYRIGYLSPSSPSDPESLASPFGERGRAAFRQGLRELGYVEGQNVVYQARWGNGQAGRLPGLAADLLAAKVDIFVTAGNPASLAAKQATSSIPIVTATGPDPVELGLAASLARPGGNVTGMTSISGELSAKRVELFKELIPQVSRAGVVWDRGARGSTFAVRDTERAARSLGIVVHGVPVSADPSSYQTAFAELKRSGVTAVIVVQSSAVFANYRRVADLALTHRLPSMGGSSEYADAGGLMSYGADYPDLFRRAALYVDRILKGAKPADMPVQAPTKYELVLNLKTAKALGLDVPATVLGRADEVIE
jgi:putative tryptophan/tyrosine transport system substrate-binding protein